VRSPDARKSPLSLGPMRPGPDQKNFGHNCKHMFAERTGDVDVAKTNMVEAELDSFVNRRDVQRRRDEGERPAEAMYAESVRRYDAKRQQELAWQWLRYHARQLRNHETTSALITAHHRGEIERYERLLNINHEGGDAA
jgi:hypothetical protein